MKKYFSYLILFLMAIVSSGCIYSPAVQQLNKIAAQYMENGDTNSAISRLESSVDLDGNIYESRYNLAVAYIKVSKCKEALEQIAKAQELAPEEPALYYILGLSNKCLANQINDKIKSNNEKNKKTDFEFKERMVLLDDYVKYLQDANMGFEKYLELAPNTDETQEITRIIIENKELIEAQK